MKVLLKLKCKASLTQIHSFLGVHRVSRTVLGRYLYLLGRKGFIERFKIRGETWAKIRLEKIQQLRREYGVEAPIMYLGLLGLPKPEYPEPETVTAIRLLLNEGTKVSKIVVVSSKEALERHRDNINSFLKDKNVIIKYLNVNPYSYTSCRKVFDELVKLNLETYSIICDVTGGTKIMTLALAETAYYYKLPIMYIPLPSPKIIRINERYWKQNNLRSQINSKEDL